MDDLVAVGSRHYFFFLMLLLVSRGADFLSTWIGTTSVLVAARNFQVAWLMRSLGEENYRDWYVERLRQTGLPLYLFCLLGQTLLTASVGGALMYFTGDSPIPFAVGFGIVGYALAVTFYTLLALWRIRRASAE